MKKKLFIYQPKRKKELEEAAEYMTTFIQEAATISTRAIKHQVSDSHNIRLHIKELVYEIAELDADGKIVEIREIKYI
jgi:hypothetical protein